MNEYSPRSTASGPFFVWAITASTVGRTFQISEVTTCSGASSFWSTIIPMTGMSASSAAAITPSRSANRTSAPAETWACAACLAAAGSKKLLMNETFTVASGLVSFTPSTKALTMRLTSGIGIAPTTPIVSLSVRPPASMPARYAGSCSQLSNTLMLGSTGSSPEPNANGMSGNSAATLRTASSAANASPMMAAGFSLTAMSRNARSIASEVLEVVDVLVLDLAVRGRLLEGGVDRTVPGLLERGGEHAVHQRQVAVLRT